MQPTSHMAQITRRGYGYPESRIIFVYRVSPCYPKLLCHSTKQPVKQTDLPVHTFE
jgi:hypothetical protein